VVSIIIPKSQLASTDEVRTKLKLIAPLLNVEFKTQLNWAW